MGLGTLGYGGLESGLRTQRRDRRQRSGSQYAIILEMIDPATPSLREVFEGHVEGGPVLQLIAIHAHTDHRRGNGRPLLRFVRVCSLYGPFLYVPDGLQKLRPLLRKTGALQRKEAPPLPCFCNSPHLGAWGPSCAASPSTWWASECESS